MPFADDSGSHGNRASVITLLDLFLQQEECLFHSVSFYSNLLRGFESTYVNVYRKLHQNLQKVLHLQFKDWYHVATPVPDTALLQSFHFPFTFIMLPVTGGILPIYF